MLSLAITTFTLVTASCLSFYIILSKISSTLLLLMSLLIITMPPAHLTGLLLPFHLIYSCQRMNTASSYMDSIMFPCPLKTCLKFVKPLRHFFADYALNTIFRIRIIPIALIPTHLLIYSQEPPPGHHGLLEKTSFLTRQYPNATTNLINISNQTRHKNPTLAGMKFQS